MSAPLHLQEINRARDYYNPLRGLDIPRVVRLLDDGERGKYDELQKLNRMAEKRHPTLKGLKARRLAALEKLDWDCKVPEVLPPGITAAQAETQRAFLRESYDQIGNLPQAISFSGLRTFRGFIHLEKRHRDDNPSEPVVELKPVPQYHWLRDPHTWEWKYDANARHDLTRAVPVDPADFMISEVDDPLCEIALLCFIRRGLAKKDWTAFMEDYAIASVFATLGENTPLDKVKEWLEVVKQVTSNSRGALPPGSEVKLLEAGQLDGVQFSNFISAEDQDLVLAGTGGLLTMLTASTGLGGETQGQNHQDAFDAIAQAEAMQISAFFQKQFDLPLLQREFPSQPIVAYWELAARDEEDVNALADRVQKFATAGLEADANEISEKAALKLTRKVAPEVPPGQYPGFRNPAGDQPLKNRQAAQEAGVEARFLSHAEAEMAAADQEAMKPLINRVASLLEVIDDDTKFEAGYRRLLADLPALEAECLGDHATAAQEEAFSQILGTAVVSGIVDGVTARIRPAQHGPNTALGRKTAPSTRAAVDPAR